MQLQLPSPPQLQEQEVPSRLSTEHLLMLSELSQPPPLQSPQLPKTLDAVSLELMLLASLLVPVLLQHQPTLESLSQDWSRMVPVVTVVIPTLPCTQTSSWLPLTKDQLQLSELQELLLLHGATQCLFLSQLLALFKTLSPEKASQDKTSAPTFSRLQLLKVHQHSHSRALQHPLLLLSISTLLSGRLLTLPSFLKTVLLQTSLETTLQTPIHLHCKLVLGTQIKLNGIH